MGAVQNSQETHKEQIFRHHPTPQGRLLFASAFSSRKRRQALNTVSGFSSGRVAVRDLAKSLISTTRYRALPGRRCSSPSFTFDMGKNSTTGAIEWRALNASM